MPATVFDYVEMSRKVKDVLRREFPHDTIATSEGYHGRVRVKLVSERFNGMGEPEKQDLVWSILKEGLGADAQAVSLAIVYGTDEL